MEVDVAGAAEELGISPRAVLDRIVKGALPARRVGRMWLVDRSQLDVAGPSTGGRRLSTRSAWAVLAALDVEGEGDWTGLLLSRSEQARAVERAKGPGWAAPRLLAARADPSHWRVHPSAMDELIADPDVVSLPLDLGGVLQSARQAYVRDSDLRAVERRWPLSPVAPSAANLVLRSARAIWPFKGRAVPAVVAAADLLDGGDGRGVREAQRIFAGRAKRL